MTTKNRDRLRPLQDPKTLRRLLLLPERLFARAEHGGDTQAAVLEREDAVAIAILLTAPIRRKNLVSIHLDQNLHRPGDGSVYLVFTPEEVKNRQPIEFELPPAVVTMIDRLLATRSPRLCPPATPWLFPRRDGTGPMHEDGLSKRIRERIRREMGLAINPHLFRHLSAMLLLDANPGAYETVRHLLGHSQLSSTLNVYTGLEAARPRGSSPRPSTRRGSGDGAAYASLGGLAGGRSGPLDGAGALGWSAGRRRRLVAPQCRDPGEHSGRYARWLGWLKETEPEVLALAPEQRATPARLLAWLESMSALAPASRAAFIDGPVRVLSTAAPQLDWSAQFRLRRIVDRQAARSTSTRKLGRIKSTGVLLDAGLELAGDLADAASTELEAAKRRRDGTMIARPRAHADAAPRFHGTRARDVGPRSSRTASTFACPAR